MNRFIGYIQVACCCLLLCASCVRDGMDEDCNSYVRFVYDYNLEYIDLFHKQATKMNLYVFDEKGVFVTEFTWMIMIFELFRPMGGTTMKMGFWETKRMRKWNILLIIPKTILRPEL